MSENNQTVKVINRSRVWFSIMYALIALVFFIIFDDKMFYFNVQENSWNIYRFVWCCIAVSLGFAVIAFSTRFNPRSPIPEYIFHYPPQLIAMATLVFSALHIFQATSGFIFYYLSFGMCFTLGYLVDSYWTFVVTIIGRSNK